MTLAETMAQYAENVSELRFDNNVKLVKIRQSATRGAGCHGWMIFVTPLAGRALQAFSFDDEALFRDINFFSIPSFFTNDFALAVEKATSL